MVRKSWIAVGLALLLLCGVALSAGAQGKLGLVFNIWDFLAGSVDSSDGISAGLGVKYWLAEKMAIRGILDFEYARNATLDTTDTYFGVSGTFEYHFKPGKVSPYAGGVVGVGIVGGDTSNLDLLLGGLFGVEVRVMDSLGFFGEYSLFLNLDEPTTNIGLGAGNNAAIGVVVYLP